MNKKDSFGYTIDVAAIIIVICSIVQVINFILFAILFLN